MDESKIRTERFLALFNQLEHAMKMRLGHPPERRKSHHELLTEMCSSDSVFRAHKTDLFAFKDLRNAIVHNANADVWNPIASPHPEALELYESLVRRVVDPPAVESVAIPKDRIFHVGMSSPLIATLETMEKNSYGLAPVVESGRVIGALTEVSIVRAAIKSGSLHISASHSIESLADHVIFDRAGARDVAFCKAQANVASVQEAFDYHFRENKRLLAVLVTDTGAANGQLLGLVTAHDLIALQNRS